MRYTMHVDENAFAYYLLALYLHSLQMQLPA